MKSKVTVYFIPLIIDDLFPEFLPQVFNVSAITGTLRCYGYDFEGSHLHNVQLSFKISHKSDSARLLLYSRLQFLRISKVNESSFHYPMILDHEPSFIIISVIT